MFDFHESILQHLRRLFGRRDDRVEKGRYVCCGTEDAHHGGGDAKGIHGGLMKCEFR